jgi:hypothetical protein
MNVLKLFKLEEELPLETRLTFMDIDGAELILTEFGKEFSGDYRWKTENQYLKADYQGVATCNLITTNNDGGEQKLFKYVLQDNASRTLLVSQKELDEMFEKL